MVASDSAMLQLSLTHSNGANRHAAANSGDENNIIAIDFDPRRELMFWIDTQQNKIFRSAVAKGVLLLYEMNICVSAGIFSASLKFQATSHILDRLWILTSMN